MKRRSSWFTIRAPLAGRRALTLKIASFIVPFAIWCLVSYVPWIWHPMIRITDAGGSDMLVEDMLIKKADFAIENQTLAETGKAIGKGIPANPIFLPAPHEVARAFYTALVSKPEAQGDPWLYQNLLHSAEVIFSGFFIAAITAVPLGILCGTFDVFSKLIEPFIDFIRYMPYPMFAGLCIEILGIDTAPKIAIVWTGLFFQLILIVANTTRQVEPSLLEAAQTLGATRKSLLPKVVLPAILPNLYNDLRIMLGVAWTILIIAELEGGVISGISFFLNIERKHRHFDNVYAGMLMIGIIGLVCDQFLSAMAPVLFPWLPRSEGTSWLSAFVGSFTFMPQRAIARRSAERARKRAILNAMDQARLAQAQAASEPDAGDIPGRAADASIT